MLSVQGRAPRPEAAFAVALGLSGDVGTAVRFKDVPSDRLVPVPAQLPCLGRKPKSMPLGDWMMDVLVRCRGAIASLPRSAWPVDGKDADTTVARIFALDPERAIGQAWWWLWKLRSSEYMDRTAYAMDDTTPVYHTDGLDGANEWLPVNEDYDASLDAEMFEQLTLAGFSVAVRYVPPPVPTPPGGAEGGVPKAQATLDKLPAITQRLFLELEAAANGVAPAVLSAMIVSANDEYKGFEESAQVTPAAANVDKVARPSPGGNVGAVVTVTQRHSFRLGDLLKAYNKVLAKPLLMPSLPAFNGSLYELTAAVARKVRTLARMRILKLNTTPDTIVFCPRLVEDGETGGMQAQGYGYEGMEAVKGIPFMCDFDPLYTKRIPAGNTEYDPDCAYVVMMLLLLSSAKAQYGEAASRVMINKVIGRSVNGATLPPEELPERFEEDIDVMAAARRSREAATVFCTVLRSALPSYAKEMEMVLGPAYAELARDFAAIMQSQIVEHWGDANGSGSGGSAQDAERVLGGRDRPIFEQLVRYLSRSTQADTTVFSKPPSHAGAVMSRERTGEVETRLEAVRETREARTRAR